VNAVPAGGSAAATVADTPEASGLGGVAGCYVIDYKTTVSYSAGTFSGTVPTDPVKTTSILACTLTGKTINFAAVPALEAGYSVKVRVNVLM
jgi:hypothetical protein